MAMPPKLNTVAAENFMVKNLLICLMQDVEAQNSLSEMMGKDPTVVSKRHADLIPREDAVYGG